MFNSNSFPLRLRYSEIIHNIPIDNWCWSLFIFYRPLWRN